MPKPAVKTDKQKSSLRAVPSVDALMRSETGQSLRSTLGAEQLAGLCRNVTDELRAELRAGGFQLNDASASIVAEAEQRLLRRSKERSARGVHRVINATGVILHTNLGRAPLSDAARRALTEAAGYCNLEFDLNTGSRGRRGARAEDLLAMLTGTEAALIVNNCAAAALLVLTVFARGGETIVSRGELVEIGGDFRVPEVMAQSNTRMIEVGTTNRTKLADYRKAITTDTRMIMRVHTSNYRIVGFTETPGLTELAKLAHDENILVYEDAGSGALINFTKLGVSGEPVIRESFAAGADVISFSGDKLLGGPQAGLIVGRAEVIQRLRTHPLYRALRADKFRIAALEATLDAYAQGNAANEIPAHKMISSSVGELRSRTETFVQRLAPKLSVDATVEIHESESAIGGGAAPTSRLPTAVISLSHESFSANQIEAMLRQADPPVVSRIETDRVLLDLRTVAHDEEPALEVAIVAAVGSKHPNTPPSQAEV